MPETMETAKQPDECPVRRACGRIGAAAAVLIVAAGVLLPFGWSYWVGVAQQRALDELIAMHETTGALAFSKGDYQAALTAFARARGIRGTPEIERKVARTRAELVAIRPDLLEARVVPDLEYECRWLLASDASAAAACRVVTGHIAALGSNPDAAKKAYEEALQKDKDHAGAHLGLALLAYRSGDAKTAQSEFDAVLARVPDHLDALIGLGDIHLAAGEADQAIDSYTKAIRAREDARAHHGLGLALARTRKTQEAVTELQKSIALNPQAFDSYVALGNLLAGAGAFPQAEQAFRGALAIRQDPQVQRSLASVLTRLGRAAEAMQLLTALLNAGARDPQVLLEAARALEALGRKDEARGFYEATANAVKDSEGSENQELSEAIRKEAEAGLQRTTSPAQTR